MDCKRHLLIKNRNVSCEVWQSNAEEIDQFITYWNKKERVGSIIIADCGNWLGKVADNNIIEGKLARSNDGDTWLAPCSALWTSLHIFYDGRVSPCCEDAALISLGYSNYQIAAA